LAVVSAHVDYSLTGRGLAAESERLERRLAIAVHAASRLWNGSPAKHDGHIARKVARASVR
jgi:hypothetical protein